MASKSTVLLFLVPLILISLLPHPVGAENSHWWKNTWAYRQELHVPIDTTADLARFQPVDTTVVFEHQCWAPDEQHRSVRVVAQTKDTAQELESQIYDLNHTDASHISSCSLVFLIPKNVTGDEQYFMYYDGSETASPNYPDHVSIEDSSYSYEPLPGYPLQSHFYKISQDGFVVYAVSQEGEYLWYSTSQYVTKLVEGATEMIPKNGEVIASFDFAYYYGGRVSEFNSTSQHLVSKEILTDGNLMVSCRIMSRSNGDDLETTAVYKYYYCPTPQKRIQAHVTHATLRDCLVDPITDTDGTYATLQCGRVRSTSIQDLNFGILYPYLHLYSERNTTEEYPVDLNLEYSQNERLVRLIGTNDDVDLGANAWADFDEGSAGVVHALIFGSDSVVKAGVGERDGIQLKLYESAYPHLPGLQNDVAGFECTRNAYEAGNGPRDYVIPKGFLASFDVEFFSAPSGGSLLVAQEASLFQSLARIKPVPVANASPQRQETNRYSLTVVVRHAPSFPLGADLSVLTGRNFPFITCELYQDDKIFSSGTAVRLPVKPFSGSPATFFGRLVAVVHSLDVRNLSLRKKFQFPSLEPGQYLVKVFKENPLFRANRQYIGYATINLQHNQTTNVLCTREGYGRVFLTDQHGTGIHGAMVALSENNVVVAENRTDQQGTARLTAPCGMTKEYTLQISYKGFVIDSEQIPFRTIRTFLPFSKKLQIDQYDWTFALVDTWGLPLAVDVTPQLSSDEMRQTAVLSATQQEPGLYTYTGLLPATYYLQIQYKSFGIEPSVTIPSESKSFVFPAAFAITFHVSDSHGLELTDTTITINRSGKTATLIQNSSSTLATLPPGDYSISVVSHGNIVGKRPLTVTGERTVDLITTQEPLFPFLIIIIIIALGVILSIYSIIKKDLVLLFTLLSVLFAVTACMLPWWSLAGNSSDVSTSSVFYLAPLRFVTTTKAPSVITGELAYVPDLFVTVISLIPAVIAVGCFLCFASLAFRRINKKKMQLLSVLGAILLFGGSLMTFSLAMTTYSQGGVGSFIGDGAVEVSVPGINSPLQIQCHWGPAEGFILFVLAVIVLLSVLLTIVVKKKK